MYGPRYGRGRRGRGKCMRWIGFIPPVNYFHPAGIIQPPHIINLTLEELEAIRLVDLEHLTQEEAALRMGVSRKTLWNDLKSGREKLARALINGYPIRIGSGSSALHPSVDLEKIEDEKVREIYRLLPGRSCGICGYTSCIEFARALIHDNADINLCRFLDSTTKGEIRKILERR